MENTTTAQQQANTKTEAPNREFIIKCSIRRKPNLPKGIPGESPLSRTYKLAAALAKGGRGPQKGISGDLERIIMPLVINVTSTEPDFYNKVNSYWNEIGVVIPADEESINKDKGRIIEIRGLFTEGAKKMFEKAETVESQINILSQAIVNGKGRIFDEYVPDFLLLAFALIRTTVANKFDDISKSSNILFYISDTNTTIKQQLSEIELITKASKIFNTVIEDDVKVKSLLTLLKVDLGDLDSKEERIIALHNNYTKAQNVKKFLDFVEDRDLLFKYLVTSAINEQKLREQPNTGNVYYHDILIGKSVDEAVMYLKSPEKESREILRTLEGELSISTNSKEGITN